MFPMAGLISPSYTELVGIWKTNVWYSKFMATMLS